MTGITMKQNMEIKTNPEHPSQTTDGSSQVGNNASLDSTQVGTESRTAVESEPTEPEQNRAQNDVGSVVGLVCKSLGSVATTFAEVDRNSKCGGTGRNVDGSSTGEIVTSHDKGPTVGVPRPARDGIVNYSRPDEDKDHNWTEATAFCEGANGEGGSVDAWKRVVSMCWNNRYHRITASRDGREPREQSREMKVV